MKLLLVIVALILISGCVTSRNIGDGESTWIYRDYFLLRNKIFYCNSGQTPQSKEPNPICYEATLLGAMQTN